MQCLSRWGGVLLSGGRDAVQEGSHNHLLACCNSVNASQHAVVLAPVLISDDCADVMELSGGRAELLSLHGPLAAGCCRQARRRLRSAQSNPAPNLTIKGILKSRCSTDYEFHVRTASRCRTAALAGLAGCTDSGWGEDAVPQGCAAGSAGHSMLSNSLVS